MLFPDAFAIWITALLLVVATRDVLASFLPLTAIMVSLTWMSSDANQETGADTFDHVVRRLTFMLYGALAGFAIAAATGTRVFIPMHTFSGKNPHWAGVLSIVSASFIPYTLAVAVGWAEPLTEWDGNTSGRQAWYSILFAVLVFILGSVLITSWWGWHRCPMAYRYGDSGLYANEHPPSRFATESALCVTLLSASHLIWIYTTYPPVSWPQYAGGIIVLGFKAALWIAIWRFGAKRYDMDGTHFHPTRSWVSWRQFIGVLAFVDLASTFVWIFVAMFSTTGLSAELALLFTTVGVFAVAGFTWLFWTPVFAKNPAQGINAPVARRRGGSSSGGSGAMGMSDEERQRRLLDLL